MLQRKQRGRSKPSVTQVLKDLVELQEKYHQVCQVLETTQQHYVEKMCEGVNTSETPKAPQDQTPSDVM